MWLKFAPVYKKFIYFNIFLSIFFAGSEPFLNCFLGSFFKLVCMYERIYIYFRLALLALIVIIYCSVNRVTQKVVDQNL